MDQVAGGYEGSPEWLKGYSIVCPNCGNGDPNTVKIRYTTALQIYYKCESFGQKFFYSLRPNNRVRVYKE